MMTTEVDENTTFMLPTEEKPKGIADTKDQKLR